MVFTTRPNRSENYGQCKSYGCECGLYTLQGAVDFFTRNAVEGEKTIMLDEGKFEEIVNIRTEQPYR